MLKLWSENCIHSTTCNRLSIFQLKESVHFDMENIKTRLEDVNLKNRLYLEREHAVFGRQLSDFHSDTANLRLRVQDLESKNTKVPKPTGSDGRLVSFVSPSNC